MTGTIDKETKLTEYNILVIRGGVAVFSTIVLRISILLRRYFLEIFITIHNDNKRFDGHPSMGVQSKTKVFMLIWPTHIKQ